MKKHHFFIYSLLLVLGAIASLQLNQPLSWNRQLTLLFSPMKAESFADYNYVYSQLPRVAMTILVGGSLGLVGSLMQQLTQNRLTSPFTLGTSSGAWLALIVLSVWLPDAVADQSAFAAMTGALIAFGLIILIAGIRNITGLPMIISGMVINILLGAIASGIILLNQQYAQNIFMWGAGDLTQNGWESTQWLFPRLFLSIPLLLIAPRLLTLMRLGQEGASARGLAIVPTFFILMLTGIWLVSASVTAVGLIGFIGLLSPNIAKALGARTPGSELWASLILGALLLLITDILSISLGQYLGHVIPSGVTAAAIGAPALIWFNKGKPKAEDQLSVQMPGKRSVVGKTLWTILFGLFVTGAAFYFLAHNNGEAWHYGLPGAYQWELRWPRAITSLSAGIALAVAGTILQRLIHNPLASPDLLGVSSGATLALVIATLFFSHSLMDIHWTIAMLGSLVVLVILLLLGKRQHYSPSTMILTGIAITALLQAFIQFCLAKGNQDSYSILQWLAGSTYRVTHAQALLLAGFSAGLVILSLCSCRGLTLLSVSRDFARARGLNTSTASFILLGTVALLCSVTTATMGPVSFIGLIAPHMALMMGAKKVHLQILLSAGIGGTVMLWADWLGQVILFPNQIAAGILVSIIGAVYFLILTSWQRITAHQK